jgi:hypothetical protein
MLRELEGKTKYLAIDRNKSSLITLSINIVIEMLYTNTSNY